MCRRCCCCRCCCSCCAAAAADAAAAAQLTPSGVGVRVPLFTPVGAQRLLRQRLVAPAAAAAASAATVTQHCTSVAPLHIMLVTATADAAVEFPLTDYCARIGVSPEGDEAHGDGRDKGEKKARTHTRSARTRCRWLALVSAIYGGSSLAGYSMLPTTAQRFSAKMEQSIAMANFRVILADQSGCTWLSRGCHYKT